MAAEDFVMFPVPADRVSDVANFLFGSRPSESLASDGNTKATPSKRQVVAERAVPDDVERLAPVELIARIYEESEPTFRAIMVFIASWPDSEDPVPFDAVSQAIGWTNRCSLAGALGAYGNRANHRYGGAWPMRTIKPQRRRDSRHFVMPGDIAHEILTVHAIKDLPLTED